jgi:hypothetical protein
MSLLLLAALFLHASLGSVPSAYAAGGFNISAISSNTSETGGTATFAVALNSQPTANVTIGLTSNDTTEGTVSPASLTFTTANWNTPQTVTVTGVDDLADDGDIAYAIVTAAASSADSSYNGVNPADVAVTNLDNDSVGITVSGISGNTSETGGTASFTVVLNSQPTGNVTIGLTSSDTGEGTVSPGTLTFTTANWNTPQTVTVTGVNDFGNDGDQLYTIVTAPANGGGYTGVNAADVSLYNIDNDANNRVIVSGISGSTSEAGGTATFTVRLNNQPSSNVTIALSSSDTSEGTVSPASLTFSIGNWNNPQTVTVTGVNDDLDDGNIAYTIVIAAASGGGYTGVNAADVPVVNVDNDTAGFTVTPTSGLVTTETGGTASFSVKLNSQPTANVTIGLSSSDTTEGSVSPASLTFTSANWNTAQNVTATGVDDSVDDGDIAYSIITAPASSSDSTYNLLNPANVAATNQDNDTAGITVSPTSGLVTSETGGIATFTIKLDSQPIADVIVSLSSSDATEGQIDAGSLTFTSANWNSAQTVSVSGVNDDLDDGDIAYTIVTGAASSTDANYNNRAVADVSALNADDDTAGITVSGVSGNTTEAGGTASFTIVLDSQPTANVTIGLSSSDTTEGSVSPASLTFTPASWNTPQAVTATGVDDAVDDGDIAYAILIGASASTDAKYSGIDVADANLSNIDDDGAGILVSAISGSTSEAGGSATFTVKLASQPTANVTIGLSSSDTTEGAVSPASLAFSAANWNIAQTVTVGGVNDDLDDGNIAYTINFDPATSSDPNYSGMNAADVPVTNTDDDIAGISVSGVSGDTTETGGTASFTIVLDSQPSANVTIGLSSSDATEGSVSPALLTFTPASWNTPQTVTATGVNDDVDDGNQSYTIITAPAVSSDTNYDSQNASDVSLNNIDDDTAGILVSSISGNTTETGGQATFTVVLSSQPLADVVIALSSSNLAEGAVSDTALTFTDANWNSAQIVTVSGVNDNIDDGNVSYTIITGAASSADGNYNNSNANDVSVVNVDDDTAGISVSGISGNTSEAGGTASFTIVLDSQPTANVSFALSSSDTAEVTVSPAPLTFTPAIWSTPQSATVTGVDDLIDDGDIAYTIVTAGASSSDPIYSGMDAADVSLSNIDNDGAGVVVSTISGITSEAGGTATFDVQLASQPTADVSIGLSTNDPTEGAVSPATLTFTSADWNVPQTVTVTGVNDDLDDGDISYLVLLAPSISADLAYNGQDAADIPALNLDDDTAGITITPPSANSTSEAGATATFSVVLNTQPIADVTIGLSSSDTTEGTVGPASLTFTAANWNQPQTVTVTGVNDSVDDNNVAYTIVVAPAVSADPQYSLVKASDVSLSNIDDDTAGISVSGISGNTTESGGTATFTVVLNSQPTANVSIGLSSDATEGSVSPTSLTFTPANWNIAQTVTVTGIDDAVIDGNISYTIVTSAASSADQLYNGLQAADVSVVNIDNDQANAGNNFVYLALFRL